MPTASASGAPLDLRTLRRLWKPRRDSYSDALLYEENRIRIHRAFSWLEHAAECRADALEDRLLAQWAGIAALFSRWDAPRRRPVPERTALALFARQIAAHDQDGLLPQALLRHRVVVQGVFEDRYLARFFPVQVDLGALFERRRWERVLTLALDRAALVHAQTAGGGATHGSRENRVALRRTTLLLDALAIVFVQIVINHGYSDEWGDLCWPPDRARR
jgi:hypothetical protein